MTEQESTQTTEQRRCAAQSEAGSEQLAGTAPVTTGWLLVEQPGTWGPETLRDCGLAPDIAAALEAWGNRTGGRVALLRRPGRGEADGERRWFMADSRPGREEIRGATFGTDADLAAVITALDGPDLPGAVLPDPIYLVCAHGRHDACCAIRGRPVAAALTERHPERTWESTHLGGHRFAANLVLLPHSIYFGHVPPADAVRLVREYGRGLVDPTWMRGRSCYPAHVQAAQHFARVLLREHRIDALAPSEMEYAGDDRWVVRLARDAAEVTVTLQETTADVGPLSCGDLPSRSRAFDLIDIATPSAVLT